MRGAFRGAYEIPVAVSTQQQQLLVGDVRQ